MTAQTILPANSVTGGFDVDNSVRLDGTSAYLKFTSSAGNRRTWTYSTWVKRSKLTNDKQNFISSYAAQNDAGYTGFRFQEGEVINLTGWSTDWFTTTRVFRDLSAWYHIVLAVDTTNATAGNRLRLYVNGVEETSFSQSNNPDENEDLAINVDGEVTYIASEAYTSGGSRWFNGYIAETVLIDGLQLTPSSFGEFDSDSGIWKPKDVSGLTRGTNGFYLDFKDSSNLGNDAFGDTDLTEVNLAATDQSTDTPINNFATINALDNFYAGATLSEGNLRVVTPVAAYAPIRSTIGVSSGKWYAEVKIITASATDHEQGVVSQAAASASAGVGRIAEGYGYAGNGQVFRNDSQVTYSANSLAADDILGIYLDLDNNKLYFAKNGTIQNSGAGISIVDPASTTDGVYYFATSDNANASGGSYQFDWNFGNPIFTGTDQADANGYGSFEYSPSAGTFDSASKDFYALNTKNLAEYG